MTCDWRMRDVEPWPDNKMQKPRHLQEISSRRDLWNIESNHSGHVDDSRLADD